MVRPKKSLGQHFLRDDNIARKIVRSLRVVPPATVLEVGAGTGVLTRHLLELPGVELFVIEIDRESVLFLREHFPALGTRLIEGDFLETELDALNTAYQEGKYTDPVTGLQDVFWAILNSNEFIINH